MRRRRKPVSRCGKKSTSHNLKRAGLLAPANGSASAFSFIRDSGAATSSAWAGNTSAITPWSCRRLAEAGCTVHEIQAISGHVSLKEIERYTKGVEQKRLANAAMERVCKKRRVLAENREY